MRPCNHHDPRNSEHDKSRNRSLGQMLSENRQGYRKTWDFSKWGQNADAHASNQSDKNCSVQQIADVMIFGL
jgi:hypothetical protein